MGGRVGYMAISAGIIGSLTITVPTLAASFSCVHTTSPRERVICRDPILSNLDGQLGRAYQARKAVLSPHGADMLQGSERNWLHFIATICPIDLPANADEWRKPQNCLEGEYRERLSELARVGQRFGPFLFNRIDLYAAERAPDSRSVSAPSYYTTHIAYPQIDSPHTPQETAWNSQSTQSLSANGVCSAGDPCDYDKDYEIGYANERVISTEWIDWFYYHGTPHGQWNAEMQNVELRPTLRALTAQDVFGPTDDWQKKLQELYWSALHKSGWSPPGYMAATIRHHIDGIVLRPDHWMFNAAGLELAFSAYEGGCYVCNPRDVVVPWTDLKPLLSRASPLP